MTYVGIDLAAEAKRTGLAVLSEVGEGVIVERVEVGADDNSLIDVIRAADRVGVDVPLGWPDGFVDLISAHADGVLAAPASTGREWRRTLAMRATDLMVHQRTGITPLSVSTDRIAHAALRWAGIEARLRELGLDTARDGSGVICEVYPAAALKGWSMPYRSYKGRANPERRTAVITLLSEKFPRLDWNDFEGLCADDDNALDSVIAGLVARHVAEGDCEEPAAEMREVVLREGWIWLPKS